MEYKTADHILTELKQGKYRPIYILHGEEAYFIDEITDYIEAHALTDSEKAFNQVVIYGRDANFKTLIDEARQYPMMSQRRVVILKEAQDMVDLKEMGSYIASPSDMTVMVIAYKNKKIDGRITWVKDAKKSPHIAMLHSAAVREYNLSKWINEYLRSKNRKIAPDANMLLAEYLGTDLKKLVNEISKVELNIPTGKMIEVADVEKYIGISKEYNIFALLKELNKRDPYKVHIILQNLVDNIHKNPVQMMIPAMNNHFQRIHITHHHARTADAQLAKLLKVGPYFVKEYKEAIKYYTEPQVRKVFKLLCRYDGQSKGMGRRSGTPPGELFKELVLQILYIK